MRPTLKLEGIGDLQQALEGLKGATAKNVVRRSLQEALEPVAEAARGRVPVDEGDTQRSIGVGTQLMKRQKRMSQPIVSGKGVEAYVGAGLVGGRFLGRAAHLIEYGTYKMAPRPFMRPAWQSNLNIVFNGLAKSMEVLIARAARSKAKKAAKQ